MFLNNKITAKKIMLFMTILLPSLTCSATAASSATSSMTDQEYFRQFQDIFSKVEKYYVQEDIDKNKMIDGAINGMLNALDPHSSYLVGEEFEDFVSHTKGEFGGIGVEILPEQSAIKVITPIDDLPAYKAGVRAGDYIVGVNGELVSNLGPIKAIKEMRGEVGTKVKILVFKESEGGKQVELELTREIVKVKPIKASLEGQNIAYIRIVTFSESTFTDLKKEFTKLEADTNNGIKGIILDLRSNPGGLLDQAVSVADYFLSSGVIVSTKSRYPAQHTFIEANATTEKAPNIPIVVLVDAGTASAAEIVAGALQDHKRAIIVGKKSFGKGSVQTLTQISPNSALKLTTSKYYTPSGKSIQAEGIEPDIVIEPAKVEYSEATDSPWKVSEVRLKNYLKNDENKPLLIEKKENNAVDTKVQDKKPVLEQSTDKAKDDKPVDPKDKNIKSETEKKGKSNLSELYKKDYQYARAYDLIRGLILTNNKPLK